MTQNANTTIITIKGEKFELDNNTIRLIKHDKLRLDIIPPIGGKEYCGLFVSSVDGVAINSGEYVNGFGRSINELCGIRRGNRRTAEATRNQQYIRSSSWVNPELHVPGSHPIDNNQPNHAKQVHQATKTAMVKSTGNVISSALVTKVMNRLYGHLTLEEFNKIKAVVEK